MNNKFQFEYEADEWDSTMLTLYLVPTVTVGHIGKRLFIFTIRFLNMLIRISYAK